MARKKLPSRSRLMELSLAILMTTVPEALAAYPMSKNTLGPEFCLRSTWYMSKLESIRLLHHQIQDADRLCEDHCQNCAKEYASMLQKQPERCISIVQDDCPWDVALSSVTGLHLSITTAAEGGTSRTDYIASEGGSPKLESHNTNLIHCSCAFRLTMMRQYEEQALLEILQHYITYAYREIWSPHPDWTLKKFLAMASCKKADIADRMQLKGWSTFFEQGTETLDLKKCGRCDSKDEDPETISYSVKYRYDTEFLNSFRYVFIMTSVLEQSVPPLAARQRSGPPRVAIV